jgi:hypothetical protein
MDTSFVDSIECEESETECPSSQERQPGHDINVARIRAQQNLGPETSFTPRRTINIGYSP